VGGTRGRDKEEMDEGEGKGEKGKEKV